MEAVAIVFLLVGLALIGMPIGFTLIAGSMVMIGLTTATPLVVVPLRLFNGTDSFAMVAVPLFILAGSLMNSSGISERLIAFTSSLVGCIRGGLAMTTTIASMFFAEISGSAVAGAAALGSVLVPAMKEKGYPAPFVAAVLSSSSTLAIIIPPSIPMILYGSITGTSIVQLFVGGVIPGVLIAGAIMVTSAILARAGGFAECEPFELRRVRRTFGSAFGALALPLIILGGIFSGAFTATEAAAVAVVAALVLGVLFYRRTRLRDLGPVVLEAAHQTGVVMILVAASAVLGWYLTNEQVPETLARLVTTHVHGRVATLFVMNGALLVAGMFLHSTAAIVLLVPIFMPLVKAIDMDPVHFGLVLTLNLAIGQQTPPVASVLITSCSIARARLGEVMRVNVYFILAMLLVLLLVTFVPEVVLWLPAQLTAK
jgi:tripartite ATP-independent transporter DctM subunit